MQCIVVKSDEFENPLPLIFLLNPDYVAARSLRSLRSNYCSKLMRGHHCMLWFNSVLSLVNFFSTSFEYDNVCISHEYETKQIRK